MPISDDVVEFVVEYVVDELVGAEPVFVVKQRSTIISNSLIMFLDRIWSLMAGGNRSRRQMDNVMNVLVFIVG